MGSISLGSEGATLVTHLSWEAVVGGWPVLFRKKDRGRVVFNGLEHWREKPYPHEGLGYDGWRVIQPKLR